MIFEEFRNSSRDTVDTDVLLVRLLCTVWLPYRLHLLYILLSISSVVFLVRMWY